MGRAIVEDHCKLVQITADLAMRCQVQHLAGYQAVSHPVDFEAYMNAVLRDGYVCGLQGLGMRCVWCGLQ